MRHLRVSFYGERRTVRDAQMLGYIFHVYIAPVRACYLREGARTLRTQNTERTQNTDLWVCSLCSHVFDVVLSENRVK